MREAKQAALNLGHKLVVEKRLKEAEPICIPFDLSSAPSSHSGWGAPSAPPAPEGGGRLTLSELKGLPYNLRLVEWDGMCVWLAFCPMRRLTQAYRTPRPILDKNLKVVAVLVGRPRDTGWGAVHQAACEAVARGRSRLNLCEGQASHRRGSFPALAVGVSFGGGRKVGAILPR